MGYYILIEKESKLMRTCWKRIIVCVLVLIVFTCFLTSIVFQSFLQNFNSNCISNASLSFKYEPINTNSTTQTNPDAKITNNQTDEKYVSKVDVLFKKFESYHLQTTTQRPQTDEEIMPKKHLYEFLNKEKPFIRTTTERVNISEGSNETTTQKPKMHPDDAEFFNNYRIDEMNSTWGHHETCAYFYYIPVVEVIFAIVWMVFTIISGHRGGRAARTFIHKSWRLVLPSAICFAILTVIGIVYAVILNSRLDGFCNEFIEKFNNTDIPCKLLLNRYTLSDDPWLSAAKNFTIAKVLPWISAFLWFLAACIMLIRCLLAADFDVEEVDCYTESTDLPISTSTAVETPRVKFNDDVRKYSHEKVYKPTTQPTTLSK